MTAEKVSRLGAGRGACMPCSKANAAAVLAFLSVEGPVHARKKALQASTGNGTL